MRIRMPNGSLAERIKLEIMLTIKSTEGEACELGYLNDGEFPWSTKLLGKFMIKENTLSVRDSYRFTPTSLTFFDRRKREGSAFYINTSYITPEKKCLEAQTLVTYHTDGCKLDLSERFETLKGKTSLCFDFSIDDYDTRVLDILIKGHEYLPVQ